jgi:tetratricopeptide (TPR) repeat protein
LESKKFFRRTDWIAAALTFLIALTVYTLTLQPTVGLEDSGELIVASDYLGVPHPPGYPIWSLLTWAFQWVFHGVTYHGYPNPAWAVNFFSAFAGALACGILALLVSRSGIDLLHGLKKETEVLGEKTERLFCAAAGVSSGLLLAFSQGMWSQAVIAEVYTLNILFQTAVLLFLYRWMTEPEHPKPLFLMAFAFGLGLTNHQTLLFMGLAIALAVFLRCHDTMKREFFFFLGASALGGLGVGLTALSNALSMEALPVRSWALVAAAGGFSAAAALACIGLKRSFRMLMLSLVFILFAGCGVAFGNMAVFIPSLMAGLVCCLLSTEKTVFRDFFAVGILLLFVVGFNKVLDDYPQYIHWCWVSGPEKIGFWFWTVCALLIPVLGLFLPNGKTVCATYLLMFLGLSFYLYMPFSSDQNPPINWGYPRTWEGFMHAITRGQYERVTLASVFSPLFIQQIGAYLHDLRSQFFGPVALLAVIPFAFIVRVGRKNRDWLFTTLLAFIGVGILFIILQNPKLDIQTLFIARVQYIQSHAIYALWLGYGLLVLMAFLEAKVQNNPLTKWAGTLLVLLLPFSLIWKNYTSEKQLRVVGGSEQNGHDFGWQFGNWQLRGVEGIKEDLWYYAGKDPAAFEAEWAKYPNPDYPPPMGTNAIFFGGTDPGRFVPTYMIYCPQVRPDVYLITQNALADNTYMAVMRDLYGDQIWIPSQADSNRAFQEFVQGVQSGQIDPGADVKIEGGRVQVQGVGGVMQINGILCRQIFDHNRFVTEVKTCESTRQSGAAVVPFDPVGPDGTLRMRDFYVEESYVIPWMYPYLTPHGLILKLNNEQTALTPEMIKNDREFWDWYCSRLLNDRKFIRDVVARKTFSKLRSAIAGLYAARGVLDEAEYAFKQAVDLYPLSPEAVFRLADLYMRRQRFDEAYETVACFSSRDERNENAGAFLLQIGQIRQMVQRKGELEGLLSSGQNQDVNAIFELIQIYGALRENAPMQKLIAELLRSNPPVEITQPLAQMLLQMNRPDLVEPVLLNVIKSRPDDLPVHIELAAVRLMLGRPGPALDLLQQAVAKGGEPVRAALRRDNRFQPLWNDPRFQSLVPPQSPPGLRTPFGAPPAQSPTSGIGGLSF